MADKIHVEILKTIGTLMTTAFAFIAGLAWNGAIEALIKTFMSEGNALTGLLIYAIVVTIIAVIATIIIGRLLGKAGVELEE